MIEESMNNMEEEIEDNDNDNESNEDEEEYEQIEIPNQDVFVLIENVFDLNSVPFINNNENIELNIDSETEEEEEIIILVKKAVKNYMIMMFNR